MPKDPSPSSIREAAPGCRACDLWEPATRVVVGEGPVPARVMLVGEQPGDREDRSGTPFVGPAGRVLDEGLQEAGLMREEVYVTNVVKHFRYALRGKRRIHQRPDRWQVSACLPWLRAELSFVQPEILVCLGATAGQALLGASLRIGRDHGRRIDTDLAPRATVTAHPSSILRLRDAAQRTAAMGEFVSDLRTVTEWLGGR